jgi:hypothetical protein
MPGNPFLRHGSVPQGDNDSSDNHLHERERQHVSTGSGSSWLARRERGHRRVRLG